MLFILGFYKAICETFHYSVYVHVYIYIRICVHVYIYTYIYVFFFFKLDSRHLLNMLE